MAEYTVEFNLRDNGGRRSGIDRRRFSYTSHIPERRRASEQREASDRRNGEDRRCGHDRRSGVDRRSFEERRIGSLGPRKKGERRSGGDRRDFTIYEENIISRPFPSVTRATEKTGVRTRIITVSLKMLWWV
jgi:hypothetical protein